jgi:hypothetical protein
MPSRFDKETREDSSPGLGGVEASTVRRGGDQHLLVSLRRPQLINIA